MEPTWQTENGDVRLFLGDSLAIAPSLEAKAVISDPPYGMAWNTDSKRFTGGKRKRGEGRNDWNEIEGDAEPFDPAPWLKFPKVILWGFHHFAERLPVGTVLAWLKKPDHLFGTFLSDAELAWMNSGHGIYCFRDTGEYMRTQSNKVHPTQKPVGLMLWCLEKAKVETGETVLDPYMGSGTTGVACIRTGKRFIGIEREEKYFRAAKERIEEELARFALFEPAPVIKQSEMF
jgi:site-specific DNA-methyltransferase (adenine-specific)